MNGAATIIDLIGRLILNIGVPLLNGDKSVLNKRVGEVLPDRLKTQAALDAAREAAEAKFGKP